MTSRKGRLGEILIAAGKISSEQLEAGLEKQRQSGQPLGMTLVHMGFLEEGVLIRLLAKQLSLPMARLEGKRVSGEVVELVPVELAKRHHCFPLFLKEESGAQVLYLGMEDATDLEALEAVAGHVGLQVRPVLVATSEIDQALARHYPDGASPAAPEAAGSAAAEPSEPAATETGTEGADATPEAAPGGNGAAPEAAAPAVPQEIEIPVPEPEPAVADSEADLPAPMEKAGEEPPGEPPTPTKAQASTPAPTDAQASTPAATEAEAPAAPKEGVPEAAVDPAIELTVEPEGGPEALDPAVPVSPEAILRALSQLLVEKGVITREEFITRVHRESDAARPRRP